ncbi:hypothetical protein BT67DRAFT_310168 [Trichocladium antarcticum]|uniref:Uncharacterized protein n=1 Tax=Trichocladium antarcticum TaxID=1450529 RepID=A0AAN6ZDD0_9PEZI|nr:hypothetical protein BT67DRAFT_310168 [Trichocladium antarcticum]
MGVATSHAYVMHNRGGGDVVGGPVGRQGWTTRLLLAGTPCLGGGWTNTGSWQNHGGASCIWISIALSTSLLVPPRGSTNKFLTRAVLLTLMNPRLPAIHAVLRPLPGKTKTPLVVVITLAQANQTPRNKKNHGENVPIPPNIMPRPTRDPAPKSPRPDSARRRPGPPRREEREKQNGKATV